MTQVSNKIRVGAGRWLLVIAALLFTFGAITACCWFFANSIAANAQQPQVAAAAIYLSPSDPSTHGRLAALKSQSFIPTDFPEALESYEQAAALAPHDWRYWLALGRMHERLGNSEEAEGAARRGVQLAPNYAQVRWLFSNILLRRGKTDEAFKEMRLAAELNPEYAIHFVLTVMQAFNTDDAAALKQTLGDSETIRMTLVSQLIEDKKLDAAVRLWQDLPEKEKQETGKTLAAALFSAKEFRTALSVYQQIPAADNVKPTLNQILNPGFESDSLDLGTNTNPFFWQIADGSQPQIALDATQKHEGRRSLALFFDSVSGTDFRNISQLVAIEGGASYRLGTFVKTVDLKTSGSSVRWEVADAADGRVLATTAAASIGEDSSSNWQKLTADFKTETATEAVFIRLARVACGLPPCPITGKILFDNFSLQKSDDAKD